MFSSLINHQISTPPLGGQEGECPVIHGFAVNTPLSETEILDAFEAHIRGDKSVDQYLLFHYISREIDRRNKKFLGRHLQWEAACLDKWHRQFQYGACLDPLSDHDIRQRVLILLTSDLSPFEPRNESSFKKKLLRNHLHLLKTSSPEGNQVY